MKIDWLSIIGGTAVFAITLTLLTLLDALTH